MNNRASILERSLVLAEEGTAQSWSDIRAQLIKEGFSDGEIHLLAGPIVMRQLLAKMATANPLRADEA
jgi:hypothetical protein